MKNTLFLFLFLWLGAASSAYAEDQWNVDTYGRVRSTVEFNNNTVGGEKLSWYDMTTDAFFGLKAKRDLAEDWKTTGTIEFDLQSADSSIYPQYMYINLENPTLDLSVGRQGSSGTTFGGDYFENIDNHLATGEAVGTGDYVKVLMKDVDLTFVTGRHAKSDGSSATSPKFDESVLALYYDSKIADTFPIAFSLANIHETPSKSRAAVALDAIHGEERYLGYSFNFGVPISDMAFSLNYDNLTQKHISNNLTPDHHTITTVLGYDLQLPGIEPGAGVSLMYSSNSVEDGTPSKTKYTGYDLGFLYPMKGTNLFLAYSSSRIVDTDSQEDDRTLLYGAGLAFHFGK